MVQLHRHNHPNKVPVVSMKIWQGSIDKQTTRRRPAAVHTTNIEVVIKALAYGELKTSRCRSSRCGDVYAIPPPADMQGSVTDDHTFYGGTLLVDIGRLSRLTLFHGKCGRN